jgi:hypothetical protein
LAEFGGEMIELGFQSHEAMIDDVHRLLQLADDEFHARDPLFQFDGLRNIMGRRTRRLNSGLPAGHATAV